MLGSLGKGRGRGWREDVGDWRAGCNVGMRRVWGNGVSWAMMRYDEV